MNSKFAGLLRFLFVVVGILACFWVIFRIFTPGELWLMIFLGVVVLCAYGLQLKTWPETSRRTRWFGLLTETEVSVYQQLTIFGLINIGQKKRIEYVNETRCALIQHAAELAISTVPSILPFGGLFGNKLALSCIGFKKAIGN